MARRASVTWIDPPRDPVQMRWRGSWPALQDLAWSLIERQPAVPRVLRPATDHALLILTCDAAHEQLCRQLGSRRGLVTTRMSALASDIASHTLPFTLRQLQANPPAREPAECIPMPRDSSPQRATGWWVFIDTPDARYARRLLAETSVKLQVYALANSCCTYLHAWSDLARTLARYGLIIRPASGLPHGHLPLTGLSYAEESGERIFTLLDYFPGLRGLTAAQSVFEQLRAESSFTSITWGEDAFVSSDGSSFDRQDAKHIILYTASDVVDLSIELTGGSSSQRDPEPLGESDDRRQRRSASQQGARHTSARGQFSDQAVDTDSEALRAVLERASGKVIRFLDC